MKGDWERKERVFANSLVVVLHVDEQGLLITEVIVILYLVVDLNRVEVGLSEHLLSSLLGSGIIISLSGS